MTTAAPPARDLTDPSINEVALPHDEFEALRRSRPVAWVEQLPEAYAGLENTPGYWAVTKHADVAAVSKNAKAFSTWENTVIIRFASDMTRDQVELMRAMLIHHDPPEHTRLRQIISRGFTPRAVAALKEDLDRRAREIIGEARERGTGNFVEDVAAELPLQAIANLLGVPQEDRKKIFEWSNQMLAYDDPEVAGDPATAYAEILGYFMAMAEERRANPKDDLVTKLITADIDGQALSTEEFGFFVILLGVAGNETTRNAITHGMHAFFQNPDQWELYKKERPDTAADEMVRWATPVTVFQRTAVEDVVVGDQGVKAGQRVALFYASANFDADVFQDPYTFNVMRDPNPHVGFGGHGAHYCIGANLARMEIAVMFNALADLVPDIAQAGEPRRLRHAWINGVKELQVRYR